jgi:putative MATE family efflux protein
VPLPWFRPSGAGNEVSTGPVGRIMFMLALPILAEQILNTFVGLVDTYLAGRINAAATSAVGLSAYVGWLASMLVMLVGTGTTALVARYEGRREHEKANHFANQSITLAVGLGILIFVLAYELAPWFARYCRMTGQTHRIAVDYLRLDAVGHLAMSVMIVGCAGLRGVGNMRTPMLIYAIINIVNVVFSWCLVYGTGPFPRMGVNGIVAGTVIAKIAGATITVALLAGGRRGLELLWSEMPIAWKSTWRVLRIGIPAAADGAIMWSGHFIFLAVISHLAAAPLGEAYFAAHVIAMRVEAFSYLPAVAWAGATATMIGQALGATDYRRAVRCGHQAVLQCVALSLLMATCFYVGAAFIYERMTVDPAVRAVGVRPFRFLAMFQPLLVTAIVYIGALRGAGDTRFPLLITIVGTIFVRVPLGYYFGIVCGWGLLGAWMGMFGDITWRAVAASIRYASGAWVRTRV